jgi:transposase-like protein
MSKCPPRTHSLEFKRRAVERIEAGEVISVLSRELGVRRQLLYKWRDAFRRGEPPRARGRPSKATVLAAQAAEAERDALAAASRRIAELERKVGQQALEIDFFRGALRRIEASRQANAEPGATASSRRSKR